MLDFPDIGASVQQLGLDDIVTAEVAGCVPRPAVATAEMLTYLLTFRVVVGHHFGQRTFGLAVDNRPRVGISGGVHAHSTPLHAIIDIPPISFEAAFNGQVPGLLKEAERDVECTEQHNGEIRFGQHALNCGL